MDGKYNEVTEPIFKPIRLHPEEAPIIDEINNTTSDIIKDIAVLNTNIGSLADSFRGLMEITKQRLSYVKNTLQAEKERLIDSNILCSKFTDFTSVVDLTGNDFTGDFVYENNLFKIKTKASDNIPLEIIDVTGNGYEGNANAFKDNKFLIEVINTSNRDFIIDKSPITVYEYSRITASDTEQGFYNFLNLDSIEAKCTITISSDAMFNALKIESDSKDIILTELKTSLNGIDFETAVERPIVLYDTVNKYNHMNYIPGSGILLFPDTKFVKISLQSNSYTDDLIGYEKIEEQNSSTQTQQEESFETIPTTPVPEPINITPPPSYLYMFDPQDNIYKIKYEDYNEYIEKGYSMDPHNPMQISSLSEIPASSIWPGHEEVIMVSKEGNKIFIILDIDAINSDLKNGSRFSTLDKEESSPLNPPEAPPSYLLSEGTIYQITEEYIRSNGGFSIHPLGTWIFDREGLNGAYPDRTSAEAAKASWNLYRSKELEKWYAEHPNHL